MKYFINLIQKTIFTIITFSLFLSSFNPIAYSQSEHVYEEYVYEEYVYEEYVYEEYVIEEYIYEEYLILENAIDEIEVSEGVTIDDYSLQYATAEEIQSIEEIDSEEYLKSFAKDYAKHIAISAGFIVVTASITLATGGAALPILVIIAKDIGIDLAGAATGATINVILEITRTGKIDKNELIKRAVDGATVGIAVASVASLSLSPLKGVKSASMKISKSKGIHSITKNGEITSNIKTKLINISEVAQKNIIYTSNKDNKTGQHRLKYLIKGKKIKALRKANDEYYEVETVGRLKGNQIINKKGALVGQFTKNKNGFNTLEAGLQESLNKGIRLTPDYLILNRIKNNRVYDDNSNIIATIISSSNDKKVKHIMDFKYKRIIGQINKKNKKFLIDWRKNLTKTRVKATSKKSKRIHELLTNGVSIKELKRSGVIHPNVPEKYLNEFKKTGKLANKLDIHHKSNVANHPDLAGDSKNLILVDKKTHKELHGGSYLNPSTDNGVDCYDTAA